MTEQSSCKRGFFGKYLRYRIGTLSSNLVICSVLNLLGLPFFSLGILFASSSQLNGTDGDSNFTIYATFFGSVCVYALVLLAVTGAAFAFSYFNKKELTDTLGALPLTHRQRFWGDFLGGYIANVAPFIPASFVSVTLFSAALKNYDAINGTGEHIGFVIGLVLTLFFVYTFGYIISVLATVTVGRFMFAEIFSVLGTVVFTLLISSVSKVFLNAITGFSAEGEEMLYAVPFGPLFGDVGKVISIETVFGKPFDTAQLSTNFMILKPLNIVIFIVLAAALIALAYFVTKSRKQENVGRIAAHAGAFRTMALLTAAAAVMFAVANYGKYAIFPSFFIGAVIGLIIVGVFELIRRPRSKEIIKTIIGYAATLVLCFELCVLFRETGAFGLRYINIEPENVEYLNIITNVTTNEPNFHNDECKLTEKEDIKRFTENHNSILKTYDDQLQSGSNIVLAYRLNDGTTLLRGYQRSETGSKKPLLKMIDNLHSLDGYPRALCGFMTDGSTVNSCWVTVEGVYGEIAVPQDKLSEFLEIFTSETSEKYSESAQNCGNVQINLSYEDDSTRTVNLFIQNDYDKTLKYLKTLDSSAEDDGDTHALTLELSYNGNTNLNVCVYKKDLENELVKELFSLLEQSSAYGEPYTGRVSKKVTISSSNLTNYYVPINAEKRVIEIITELALGDLA